MRIVCLAFIAFLGLSQIVVAQESVKKLNYQFYGFARGDISYDTRQNASAFEGLFLLYPLDVRPDTNGEDLNAVPNSGFYSFNSRAGLNVSGLNVFDANISAKLETDFAGFGSSFGANYSVLRIRQAYIKMQWEHTGLLVGQAWHPMFGPVTPDVISISVGAPFNPFNRSPQFRLDYKLGHLNFTGAAIYQFQSMSTGPVLKSLTYQRNAVLPELYVGADYSNKKFIAGVSLDYLTLKPRTQSIVEDKDIYAPNRLKTYKVDESLTSLSFAAYLKYSHNLFTASAKSIYGQNLTDVTMIGGYGVSHIDTITGKQEYTNFKHSTTWINFTYGKKYMGGIFAGYTKNLGTQKPLVEKYLVYGDGLNLKDLYRFSGTFTYNVPHFQIGLEYEMTTAAYGDGSATNKGLYDSSHSVTNHRIVGMISYLF